TPTAPPPPPPALPRDPPSPPQYRQPRTTNESRRTANPATAAGSAAATAAGATAPATAAAATAATTATAAAAAAARPEHHRSERHEHSEAHADREGPERRRCDGHAEAGADLPNPEGADRTKRVHLFRGRARSAARRLRLPACAGLQLSARPRRHLCVAVADSQVRSADGRHGVGSDSSAEGRRALLRADQGRSSQLRSARAGARQAVLREPHAAVSAVAHRPRDERGESIRARDGFG